jgi:hypothetical protein
MIRRLAIRLLLRLTRQIPGFPPFAFHDPQGRAYYAWPDIAEMPQRRVQEIEAIMIWIGAGQAKQNLEEIGSAIMKHCEQAAEAKQKERGTHMAAIAALTKELLMRGEIIPEPLYYALAAACCVREDEDPAGFDKTIHLAKVEAFTTAGRAGVPFFTASPAFKTLLGVSLCTAEGLRQLQMEWLQREAHRRAVLKVCAS